MNVSWDDLLGDDESEDIPLMGYLQEEEEKEENYLDSTLEATRLALLYQAVSEEQVINAKAKAVMSNVLLVFFTAAAYTGILKLLGAF